MLAAWAPSHRLAAVEEDDPSLLLAGTLGHGYPGQRSAGKKQKRYEIENGSRARARRAARPMISGSGMGQNFHSACAEAGIGRCPLRCLCRGNSTLYMYTR
eukprot:COSAG02_NODE_5371_length_4390_cov_1.893572_3_plen_101_part_00